MRALDRKLFRDLARLWAQALAIALVIAGGVATLVLAVGSFRSLEESRNAYYERYRFADVFATVRRAPKTLVSQIAEIPGVAAVDARIAKLALLDIPDFREPATGLFISLPDIAKPTLNQLYMRLGRKPEALSPDEVVISEGFAKAHGFVPGSRFSAILSGGKRQLTIVGIALSPEFIYTVGPGDIMPDDRRFGIVWTSEKALASAYDLDGAFSSVSVTVPYSISDRFPRWGRPRQGLSTPTSGPTAASLRTVRECQLRTHAPQQNAKIRSPRKRQRETGMPVV